MSTARRRGRGYTILEVSVAAVLTGLLVIGIMRWLIGLASAASSNIEATQSTLLMRAGDAIADDVRSATPCRETGTDAALVELTDTTVTLHTTTSSGPRWVQWKLNAGELQRAEAPLGNTCEEPVASTLNWVTWAEDVDPLRSQFVLIRDGQTITGGTAGSCVTRYSSRCLGDAIDMTLVRESDASAVRRTMSLG